MQIKIGETHNVSVVLCLHNSLVVHITVYQFVNELSVCIQSLVIIFLAKSLILFVWNSVVKYRLEYDPFSLYLNYTPDLEVSTYHYGAEHISEDATPTLRHPAYVICTAKLITYRTY